MGERSGLARTGKEVCAEGPDRRTACSRVCASAREEVQRQR